MCLCRQAGGSWSPGKLIVSCRLGTRILNEEKRASRTGWLGANQVCSPIASDEEDSFLNWCTVSPGSTTEA